jgi:uncharacterized protein DUF6600
MKKAIIVLLFFASLTSKKAMSQAIMNINTFHTYLDPYGKWINDPTYGTVWVYNEPGFRPYYSNGHWVYTDDGWTWVSDYQWGWAPFHYGRWTYVDNEGWIWVPGYEWAPAWVAWSGGDDYYGWAPLSPGLSIDIAFTSLPVNRWCFVPTRYIYSTSLRSHFIDPGRNEDIYHHHVTAINNIHVSNNIRYGGGPKREDVERITHHTIQPQAISYSANPKQRTAAANHINIYRPDAPKTSSVHSANTNMPIRQPVVHTQHPVINHSQHHDHATQFPQQPIQHAQPTQHIHAAQPMIQQHNQNVQQHMQPMQHSMPGNNGGGHHEGGGGRRR